MTGFACGLLIWVCLSPLSAHTLEDVRIALSAPGKSHLDLSVGGADLNTVIPLTVIVGPNPGPTLLALAGIHGSEYSPIIATQRLAQEVEAKSLSGSLILVHMANLPAYLGRTIYVSPVDQKNLNRLFPGNPQGSLSERLAYTIAQELFPLADAVMDLHSGDGNEQLLPSWTGYYARAGNAEVVERSRAMAMAFGIPHIVEFQWELTDSKLAIWAGSAAVAQGIPSIDVEAGGMGLYNTNAIAQITTGVRRVMAHLGMTTERFDPLPNPILVQQRESVKSPVDGSWVPRVDAGEIVRKGQILGQVTDWHGQVVFEAQSPVDGLLLIRLEAPPVREGETLVTVAVLPR
ncbi:MAG: succinylglutamate desuccinylase/aspartoacylase family protein [Lysobacterales bacterium]